MNYKNVKTTFGFTAFALLATLGLNNATADIQRLPEFGQQGADNRYDARFVELHNDGFEGDVSGISFWNSFGTFVDNTQAIEGNRAIRLNATEDVTGAVFSASSLDLRADTIYIVEFDYRIDTRSSDVASVVIGAGWTGLAPFSAMAGPLNGTSSDTGRFSYLIRTADSDDINLTFVALEGANVVIDNLTVNRHESILGLAQPPVLKMGFPRLSNYNLDTIFGTSLRNEVDESEVAEVLSRFHLVNGVSVDHTYGVNNDHQRLKSLNPDIVLLPYELMTVVELDGIEPIGGSAGLRRIYADGLEDEWYMRDAQGNLLPEVRYPLNYQMNHTQGVSENGNSFSDYATEFLAKSVLPSGLWDGIHLDQAEWYPNPLLADNDPFDPNSEGVLPPIDLNGDGLAETKNELFDAWEDGSLAHLAKLRQRFGSSQLLFGNAGAIPRKPSALEHLNGYQNEFTEPYKQLEGGDWSTDSATGWYDLLGRYFSALSYLQAPQIPSIQLTGTGLGTPNGKFTANGLADREPTLETRDYRRMRLGLTTALLGDGFFGYDYIDNTTAPIWFDEYSVDNTGAASSHLDDRGYLGQPLGTAVELESTRELVSFIDFENDTQLAPGIQLGLGVSVSELPSEVISGSRSGVITVEDRNTDQGTVFATDPNSFTMMANETYDLSFDYKVLDYQPQDHAGLLLAMIVDDFANLDIAHDVTALWYPDIGEVGQLRTVRKVSSEDFKALVALNERGTMAIDNIRLFKGAGGVYRRDFENGIVLVNPTPIAQVIELSDIAGPLARANIKRIEGTQDPSWNNGNIVDSALTLPSGDGIILLADTVSAPPAQPVSEIIVNATSPSSASLSWPPAQGNVAGYIVNYGLTGGDRLSFRLTHRETVELNLLQEGGVYEVSVTSYDNSGHFSQASQTVSVSLPGEPATRPVITVPSAIVPGMVVTLVGENLSDSAEFAALPPYPLKLANTELLINGVPAPLIYVSPNSMTIVVPWDLALEEGASIQVNRNGTLGPTLGTFVASAYPSLLTWNEAGNLAIALKDDLATVITPADPVAPGETAFVVASTLGILEPLPKNGAAIDQSYRVRTLPNVEINGVNAQVVSAKPIADAFGYYLTEFIVPAGVPAGTQELRLSASGYSNGNGNALIAIGE